MENEIRRSDEVWASGAEMSPITVRIELNRGNLIGQCKQCGTLNDDYAERQPAPRAMIAMRCRGRCSAGSLSGLRQTVHRPISYGGVSINAPIVVEAPTRPLVLAQIVCEYCKEPSEIELDGDLAAAQRIPLVCEFCSNSYTDKRSFRIVGRSSVPPREAA